jgi:hypothetical protein
VMPLSCIPGICPSSMWHRMPHTLLVCRLKEAKLDTVASQAAIRYAMILTRQQSCLQASGNCT